MNCAHPIVFYITLITGCCAVIFAMGQVVIRNRLPENYNLCTLFLIVSILIMQSGLMASGMAAASPVFLYFHSTLLFLVCPILYAALILLIVPADRLPPRKMLFLLPPLPALCADIYFIAMPAEDKSAVLRGLFDGPPVIEIRVVQVLYLAAFIQLAAYGAALLKYMPSLRSGSNRTTVSPFVAIYAVSILFAFMIITSGYALRYRTLLEAGVILICINVISVYLVGQRYPKIMQLIMLEAEKKGISPSLLKNLDTDTIISRLRELMSRERAFIDDELLLKHLADRLAISPHQLSQLLNRELGTNFNTFVNQYRIQDALRLLVTQPERSVLTIAFEVGFNSKAAFYKAFTRFTGMSPQQYRKKHPS